MSVATSKPVVYGDTGWWYSTSFYNAQASDYVGNSGSAALASWCRFPAVTVPQGATIVSALVTFRAINDAAGGSCAVWAYFNKAADAVAPADYTAANALVLTAARAAWAPGQLSNGAQRDTPSLTAVVQEIVNQVTWVSGNAMMLVIKDNGSDASIYRGMSGLDNPLTVSPTLFPLLTVNYTVAGGAEAAPRRRKRGLFWQ